MKIGDLITITRGDVCDTYPLSDFKNYNSQPRNNNMIEGTIIDITPKYALLKTILVENNDGVCCVRVYN